MSNIVFITGTDTSVGKTVVSSLLTSFLYQQGIEVFPIKPVETGCKKNLAGKLVGSDSELLWELTGNNFELDEICPYAFKTPAAPIVAARKEERELDPKLIVEKIKEQARLNEIVIAEGAGGLLVPIAENYSYLNLIKDCQAKVVVVVGSRLGALNHSLLTFSVLRTARIDVLGYVFNELYPPTQTDQKDALETNRAVLKELASPFEIEEICYLKNLGEIRGPEDIQPRALKLEAIRKLAERVYGNF